MSVEVIEEVVVLTDIEREHVVVTVEERVHAVEIGVEGPQGPPGPLGPPGPAGSGSASFVYTQSTPLAVWTIAHALGFFPNVTVVDAAGDEVWCQVRYIDLNTVQLSFSQAFNGTCYLS